MPNQHTIDPAQDRERAELAAKLGSMRAAAAQLRIYPSAVQNAVRRHREAALKARGAALVPGLAVDQVTDQFDGDGALTGFSVRQRPPSEPGMAEADAALPGFAFTRISSNFGPDGTLRQQWQIQSPERAELWRQVADAIDTRVARIEPLPPLKPPRRVGADRFLNSITIADGHVGAMAWPAETGSSAWDLKIAQSTLVEGGQWLLDTLPPAQDVLIKILGDFLDFDGYQPLTPASKHLLDVDGRFPKVADVGCQVIEAIVCHALRRYRRVRLVIKPGNHDPLSAWWMRKYFLRVFADNPRVQVEQSIRPYWAMLFGKTMIATHHGDKVALPQLPGIFAADFAPMWGQATYRVCHTGHLHHKHMILHAGKEAGGMMIYQHPTVASRNSWAADKGLSAAREMLGHTYKRTGGMTTTLHWTPDGGLVEEAA